MRKQTAIFASAGLWLACVASTASQQAAPAVPEQIVATIDTSQTGVPVSQYEYGMFIEHIGGTMYGSLWAEMLDDRKFYFPIVSKDPESPSRPQGNPMRMQIRKWRPVGPDDVVIMDKDNPFVGDQSPRIDLDSTTPHGIRQAGLALVNGKKYTGRIYLRGTPGAKVKVALVWGSGANDRQTISFAALTSSYKKYPLAFTAGADTTDAALEITGTGSGNFHIGTLSLMPADNIEGFRADTIPLIRQIKSGFWRYGGNYTSNLIWYHTIGDRDKRPPDWDNAWNAMQTNDLGMDEFMTLCRQIGVEPYISVNAGLGDSHSAAQQVEYGRSAREERPSGTLQREVLEHRQRAMGIVADWPHRSEVLHDQAQRIRQGDARSRSLHHPDRFRPHARRLVPHRRKPRQARRQSGATLRIGCRLDGRLPQRMLGQFRWHRSALVWAAGPSSRRRS
jgi:alpha-N-arabinofuranosidase